MFLILLELPSSIERATSARHPQLARDDPLAFDTFQLATTVVCTIGES